MCARNVVTYIIVKVVNHICGDAASASMMKARLRGLCLKN